MKTGNTDFVVLHFLMAFNLTLVLEGYIFLNLVVPRLLMCLVSSASEISDGRF